MYFSIRVPSLSRNKLIQGKKNTQRENAEPVKIDFDCVWAHPGVRSRGPPALEEVLLRRSFLPSGSLKSPFENNSCRNGSYQNGFIGTKKDKYARNCLDFERLSDGLRHVVYGYARS